MNTYEVRVLAKDGETMLDRPALRSENKVMDEVKDRLRYMCPGQTMIVKQVK